MWNTNVGNRKYFYEFIMFHNLAKETEYYLQRCYICNKYGILLMPNCLLLNYPRSIMDMLRMRIMLYNHSIYRSLPPPLSLSPSLSIYIYSSFISVRNSIPSGQRYNWTLSRQLVTKTSHEHTSPTKIYSTEYNYTSKPLNNPCLRQWIHTTVKYNTK